MEEDEDNDGDQDHDGDQDDAGPQPQIVIDILVTSWLFL